MATYIIIITIINGGITVWLWILKYWSYVTMSAGFVSGPRPSDLSAPCCFTAAEHKECSPTSVWATPRAYMARYYNTATPLSWQPCGREGFPHDSLFNEAAAGKINGFSLKSLQNLRKSFHLQPVFPLLSQHKTKFPQSRSLRQTLQGEGDEEEGRLNNRVSKNKHRSSKIEAENEAGVEPGKGQDPDRLKGTRERNSTISAAFWIPVWVEDFTNTRCLSREKPEETLYGWDQSTVFMCLHEKMNNSNNGG